MWRRELYTLMAERSSAATRWPVSLLQVMCAAALNLQGLRSAAIPASGQAASYHWCLQWRHISAAQARPDDPGRVVVMGAGIAGASVAAALKRQGHAPLVVSAGVTVADGASGNIAAVQAPRLTATDTAEARFSLTAWGMRGIRQSRWRETR